MPVPLRSSLRSVTLVIALTLGSATTARAQDGAAAAEDLFQRAKTLMTKGSFAEACPLLAESYRLDPAGGTLQNLAVCYESSGCWASALARFEELKTVSRNATPPRADRIKLAEEHLAKVRPKVSHVIFVGPEAVTEIEIDAVKYQRVAWTAGIALDPGPHAVVVEASGKVPYKTTVTVAGEGTDDRVTIPPLADAPRPIVVADVDATRDSFAERERAESERRLRRTGYFVGGAGLVLLGGAAVFGVLTIGKNQDGKDLCQSGPTHADNLGAQGGYNPNGHCVEGSPALADANAAKDSARTFAIVTDILAGVGVVAVAAGAYLVLVRTKSTAVRAAPTLAGALLEGTF